MLYTFILCFSEHRCTLFHPLVKIIMSHEFPTFPTQQLPLWGYTNEIRHTQVLLVCKKKTPTSKIVDVPCGLHLLFYQHLPVYPLVN